MAAMDSRGRWARVAALSCAALVAAWASAQQARDEVVTRRPARFSNGDVVLAGTLLLPREGRGLPGVVILHGAGAESRDPYEPDASMLARAGIATLIFDKRGTGASGGDWRTASLDDLMGDGLAGLAWLKGQPEVAEGRAGLLGVSQGGWLAPFMAARSDAVAFLIQVTASATPLAQQEMWSVGRTLQRRGFSDAAVGTAVKAHRLLYTTRPLIRRGLLPLGELWFVDLDPFLDPAVAWPRVEVPALVLFGEDDETVPTEHSVAIVEDALEAGGHPASRLTVLAGERHALGGAARARNPRYADLVTDWIDTVTSGRSPPVVEDVAAVAPADRAYGDGDGTGAFPWHSVAAVQVPAMLAFLIAFAALLVTSVLPSVPFGGPVARLATGVVAVVDALVLVGLGVVLSFLLNADATGSSPPVPLRGWLGAGSWASVVVAVVAMFAGAGAWRGGVGRRVTTCFAAVVAAAFVVFLGYWGVLGSPL